MSANDAVVRPSAMLQKNCILIGKTVNELEKQYLQEKLRRAGKAKPKIIGIDKISIRKGHTYRIVVSDLEQGTMRSSNGIIQK
jgi:hypothetical protein